MEKILGIDFSGAQRPAKKIAIAALNAVDLSITSCQTLEAVAGRNASYDSLVDIAGDASIIGIDAPLGFPAQLGFPIHFPDFISSFKKKFPDPESLYEFGKTFAREPKRESERLAAVPFSAFNLRLYRQTWAAISQVAWPLIENYDFSILGLPGKTGKQIIETCPASYWKKVADLPMPYKGKDSKHRKEREAKLAHLQKQAQLLITKDIKERAVFDQEADLLDAITCAYIAWSTYKSNSEVKNSNEPLVCYGEKKNLIE